eukprot:gnl/TRDRNA2_/TRDRNA2_64896_c1_seq1.p1 gnl/TRDRNA2_/TRDRNA2_64896_c1~~gnl/TRDRNA2_/TRDRNA2_64896_c1_seq1.p1  ORF type:complete len:134 (-),score=0.48 gnl/TRDRNA2_/TRDRNA2_64896_c1_seq1:17-358(-)
MPSPLLQSRSLPSDAKGTVGARGPVSTPRDSSSSTPAAREGPARMYSCEDPAKTQKAPSTPVHPAHMPAALALGRGAQFAFGRPQMYAATAFTPGPYASGGYGMSCMHFAPKS